MPWAMAALSVSPLSGDGTWLTSASQLASAAMASGSAQGAPGSASASVHSVLSFGCGTYSAASISTVAPSSGFTSV